MLLLAVQAVDPNPITVVARVWAPFISPMGEPFRSQAAGDDTMANWFGQADRNRDGYLTANEMQQDADRFFAILDTDSNGEIDPEELRVYEWDLASEIQVNSQWRRARGEPVLKTDSARAAQGLDQRKRDEFYGLQGAARYGLLNMPQPVAAADRDFNRSITLAEFRRAAAERFGLLDGTRDRQLGLAELQALRAARPARGQRPKRPKDGRDGRIAIPIPL
jgi:hypothetical protein